MKNETVCITESVCPHPWYVHLLVGFAFSGLFSWLLVLRQLYHRHRKKTALVLLIVNLMILAGFILASVKAKVSWDYLLVTALGVNIVWATCAWLFQRFFLGRSPGRYRWSEWRNWISPLLTAVILAAGLSVIFAVIPVMSERINAMYATDILDKKIILWDFFGYMPFFIPYGLLVGMWWAGEREKFSAASVITYLCGLLVFFVVLTLSALLFIFLLYKGKPYQGVEEWSLFSSGMTGWRGFLGNLGEYDQLAIVLAPLLLGSITRIREFLARAVVIFPAICLCLLSFSFYYSEIWSLDQGHTWHDMTSPDDKVSSKANRWAETLLARYPDHDQWPEFALLLAKNSYENEEFSRAREMYSKVADRYSNSPRWSLSADFAQSVIRSPGFGSLDGGHDIELPLVNYESYLTPNWMALLQVIRYWDKGNQSESEILIRLKSLSTSEEKIKLSPIPSLAELHDAAASLGFAVLIVPAQYETARALLNADIPVILPTYSYFNLLRGIDDSRSLLKSYSYSKISERLRESDNEEVKEILFLEQEGKGKSVTRMQHIASQAAGEIPNSFWGSSLKQDSAPYMAIVYPETKTAAVAAALPSASMHELQRESKGFLAALIALNALDAADPVQGVQWAMTSEELVDNPLAYQAGFLAERLWRTRDSLAKNTLNLDLRFSELSEIQIFFDSPAVKAFLEKARRHFADDLAAGKMSWVIRNEYADFLDRSNTGDLALLIQLAEQNVRMNPHYRRAWLDLAELYEWKNDIGLIVTALEGALQSESWNDELALLLAYRYVQAGKKEELRDIMRKIDPAKTGQNPHYMFCTGVLASWDGENDRACTHLKEAIEMRRYDPLYHLHYAEVLLQTGDREEARKALQWAIQIDVDNGSVRDKARLLLQQV